MIRVFSALSGYMKEIISGNSFPILETGKISPEYTGIRTNIIGSLDGCYLGVRYE